MPHDFLVNRKDLASTQIVSSEKPAINDQQILIRVNRYGLTANNITYGVAGDMIGYWQFFPATGDMGRIPVWGIGTVEESNVAEIPVGSRYYGYYPMSDYLVVEPQHITARGMSDASAHRASLPPTYNQYSLMTAANGFPPEHDSYQMIYRPLFMTGFVLDDYFADNNFFGAQQIILSSASSKTAFSMAYLLEDRDVRVIGLTSEGNSGFVADVGLYDDVVTYDTISRLDASIPTAYVDMSGNRRVLSEVHHHFADNLVNSCGVGITHYDAREGADPASLPGAKPGMFFAPSQLQKRTAEWGAEKLQQAINEAWLRFIADVDRWVKIEESTDVAATYQTVLKGASPDRGYIVINE
ncbi:MAG: DUF2855 family protein [Pseudomonadales bacterium]|nr:DUF2855 family protein [Pseudomonadales bacterium]